MAKHLSGHRSGALARRAGGSPRSDHTRTMRVHRKNCIAEKSLKAAAETAYSVQNHPATSMSDPTAPPIPPAQPPPKRHGCFFYGCITVLVIMLFAGIAGFLAVRYVLNKVTAFAEQYTETSPGALPAVQMSTADYEQLDKRLSAFTSAVKAQESVPPLILSGDEINALIANNAGWKQFKGKLYVTIDDDQIKGRVSIPLDDLLPRLPGLSRLKGRYLNGSAAFKVSLTNGVLVVTLQSLEAKGQKPPANVMTQFQRVNLAQNAQDDPKTAEAIGKLEGIEIKDGKVTVTTRPKE